MMRKKREGEKGNMEEIEKMKKEAEAVSFFSDYELPLSSETPSRLLCFLFFLSTLFQELLAARQNATAMITKAKKDTEEELNAKLADAREKLTKELAVAMKALEEERTTTLSTLETQVRIHVSFLHFLIFMWTG